MPVARVLATKVGQTDSFSRLADAAQTTKAFPRKRKYTGRGNTSPHLLSTSSILGRFLIHDGARACPQCRKNVDRSLVSPTEVTSPQRSETKTKCFHDLQQRFRWFMYVQKRPRSLVISPQ